MRLESLLGATGLLIATASVGPAQTCDAQRVRFGELNNALISNDPHKKPPKKNELEALTARAHEFLRQQITREVSSLGGSAERLRAFLKCILSSPEYQVFRSETNTPAVFPLGSEGTGVAVAYWIYRGGPAIPEVRPYLEVYRRNSSGEWEWLGEVGASYEKSTFFVHKIEAGISGQFWFLMSGFEIGDTGTRLHLEVASFDGKQIRTIWTRSGMTHTILKEVHPDHIVLSQDVGFREGREVFRRERLDVVPGGLRKHSPD